MKDMNSYSAGWSNWHKTSLQRELNAVRDNYKDKLGNDSKILDEITEIAGNRRYGHKLRWEMISSRLNGANLSDEGRDYVTRIADVAKSYISKTEKLKSGKVKLARSVKYRVDAAKKITAVRREYESLSGFHKMCVAEGVEREEILETELVYEPQLVETRKVYSEPGKVIKHPSLFKRMATRAAAAAVAAATMLFCTGNNQRDASAEGFYIESGKGIESVVSPTGANPVVGIPPPIPLNLSLAEVENNNLKSQLEEKVKAEKENKKLLEAANSELGIVYGRIEKTEKEKGEMKGKYEVKIASLEKKVVEGGRPDAIVAKEATEAAIRGMVKQGDYLTVVEKKKELERRERVTGEENSKLRSMLTKYEEKERKAEYAENLRKEEGKTVHGIVSRLNLPSFPIAKATIDPKTGIAKEVLEIDYAPSQGFAVIDNQQELRRIAGVIGKVYEPVVQNDKAFDDFAGNAINATPDEVGRVSDLDKLVMFSQENSDREIVSWGVDAKGKVVRPSEEQKKDSKKMKKFMDGLKEMVIVGNVDRIKYLKGVKQ